jgi:hypothetical protein
VKFTIAYTKTLSFEETIEAETPQEAEQYAEVRAYDSCEIDDDFNEVDNIEFEVSEAMPQAETTAIPEYEPPTETIAGLTLSPETDIPFGKQFRMGFYEYTIYESAVEQGYQAGIARHQDLMRDLNNGIPVMLDDAQFAAMLDAFEPKEIPSRDKALWRAHFIAGWCSVFLGLIREVKDGEIS